jgi:hypothetical protein
MYLTVSGRSSYYCPELATLHDFLEQHDYRQTPARSQYEAERWQKARSLIIVYYNGTVLLQGADTDSPRTLLDTLVADQSALPF